MKITYLTALSYPSRFINRFQVLKTTEAMLLSCDDVKLVISRFNTEEKLLAQEYELKKIPELIVLGDISFPFLRSFFFAKKVATFLKTDKSDVLYSRDVLLIFWLTFLRPSVSKSFFFESHSLGKFPDFIYKRVFSKAIGVVTTNNAKKEEIIKRYLLPEVSVCVSPNAVGEDVFTKPHNITREDVFGNEKKVVFFGGSFAEDQGIHNVLTIVPNIKEATFFFVGGSEEDAKQLKQKYNKLGKSVRFIPRVPHKQFVAMMHHADVLLAPYTNTDERNKKWRSPIKIREYMASGTPVVLSDTPAMREIASDEEVYFVAPSNPKVISEAINEIFNSPQNASAKAIKARAHARSYTWSDRASKIHSFIEKSI